MTDSQELIKKADIQQIAEKGAAIYEKVKVQFEPQDNGKFLAIDIDSEKVYLGTTSAEALELARKSHPEKVFYVVKVGFESAETLAKTFVQNK
ncbi:MAG: hypothetical protein AAB445_03655 [Patescibacteria group bacterium]